MNRSVIWFHSESIPFRLRDKRKVRNWLLAVANAEGKTVGPLNFIFCDDAYLLEINQQYLNHDTYTDIISFDYGVEAQISGDIFISVERIRENAQQRNVRVQDELHRVMAHGVLHLCGYKDKSPADKALMTSQEDKSLSLRDLSGL